MFFALFCSIGFSILRRRSSFWKPLFSAISYIVELESRSVKSGKHHSIPSVEILKILNYSYFKSGESVYGYTASFYVVKTSRQRLPNSRCSRVRIEIFCCILKSVVYLFSMLYKNCRCSLYNICINKTPFSPFLNNSLKAAEELLVPVKI